jgi:hypothetical protein
MMMNERTVDGDTGQEDISTLLLDMKTAQTETDLTFLYVCLSSFVFGLSVIDYDYGAEFFL